MTPRGQGGRRSILLLCLVLRAAGLMPAAGVHIEYDAAQHLEPHDTKLNLHFFGAPTGQASFPNLAGGPLVTVDADTKDYRGGGGRYYRRQFSAREFNDHTDLRVEITVRVLASEGSPAGTCVQFTTPDGRTFGLGFLKQEGSPEPGEVILYADGGDPLPQFRETYSGQDWLWRPVVLGRRALAVGVKRTYVLELARKRPRIQEDVVRLWTDEGATPPLVARLADLKSRVTVPGLLFGHPVSQGTGKAEWYRLAVTTNGEPESDLPRRIGHRRQLFLDDWLIERADNVRRELQHPVKHPGNPVLRRDKPWDESRCDLYGSVVRDQARGVLQLFYNCQSRLHATPGASKPRREVQLCYAESRDAGVSWTKPLLELIPFEGIGQTNIVYKPRYANLAGPCVFRDERELDPSRRYKLLSSDYGDNGGAPSTSPPGMDVAFSADGIEWHRSARNPVLPLLSDTAHSSYWDDRSERYVGFVRMRPKGFGRAVGRTESPDFEHWSPPELVFATRRNEFYSMGVTPYEGVYIGTPWIIYSDKKDPSVPPPVIEPELAFSRDGWNWSRLFPGDPFVSVGPRGSADEKQIRMSSSLVVLEDRILCFYGMSPDAHVSEMKVDVGMATLRVDGFVAMAGTDPPGRLLTRPFVLEGGRLTVNAECDRGAGGSIAVAVLDAESHPVPGLALEECRAVHGDGLRLPVEWGSAGQLRRQRGKAVRLEFRLRHARLYSFQVTE